MFGSTGESGEHTHDIYHIVNYNGMSNVIQTPTVSSKKDWVSGYIRSAGSHTHSFSGSTGKMNQNATGSVWSNYEGLFNSRSLANHGNIKLSGSTEWCGGDNEDKNCPTTMTIDVSHTHSFSGK